MESVRSVLLFIVGGSGKSWTNKWKGRACNRLKRCKPLKVRLIHLDGKGQGRGIYKKTGTGTGTGEGRGGEAVSRKVPQSLSY